MCAERREKLIYRSDFTAPCKEWMETEAQTHRVFRRDGWLHIAVNPPGLIMRYLKIALDDFKVYVDAGSIAGMGKEVAAGAVFDSESYGIFFRVEDKSSPSFYALLIRRLRFGIYICTGGKTWDCLLNQDASARIRVPPEMNTWMVEMSGDRASVELNGHMVGEIRDSRLKSGFVGVLVSANKKYSEARFRNFRLYSVEVEEEAIIMPAPMPAPVRRRNASVDDTVTYSIEKVTTRPSAKAPPPSAPRVAQPAASAQRPSDFRAYLEGILKDAGMTGLTTDLREEMIKELTERLNACIIGEIIDHMPKQYLEGFTKLYEKNRPQAEINRFIEEHVPNAGRVIAGAFEKFRGQFVGKSG